MYRMERGFQEKLSDELMQVLYDLNRCVIQSGEKMEGSLFYGHYKYPEGDNAEIPIDGTFHKRYNVLNATRGKTHMLEIGLNAGHSAGFVLECNETIKFTSIDIAAHAYTPICADYLSSRYGSRFRFLKGDSTKVFPLRYFEFTDVDLIHIDGGHGLDVCWADLVHAVFLPNTSGRVRHIILDDTGHAPIREAVIEFINRGYLATENYNNHWQGFGDMYLRVL